jgi:large subunit ribosomal protein L6e
MSSKAKAAAPALGKRRILFRKYPEIKPAGPGGKFYPTEDVPKAAKRSHKPTAAKLRASITPGTVLILLSGKYRGRRVVFLKQLESGLLLVSGPYSVNGVPLRRVNQAYVIATKTKVPVTGVDLSGVSDKVLAAKEERAAKAKSLKEKKAEAFFELQKAPAKKETTAERKALQAKVDAAIKLSEEQKAYLKARFSLTKGQRPHRMVF